MRNLFLISIFILATLASVAGNPNRDYIRHQDTTRGLFFGGDFEKALFTGYLDIKKHHLTGFLLIKQMEDQSYRIVFSNQFGMTFFDFEVKQNSFTVVYCFESLNRKALIKIFEKDFRILLASTGDTTAKGFLDKAEITFPNISGGFPSGFRIKNPRIGMEMNFSILDR